MPKWSYDSAVCCPFRCPICCPIRLEKWGVVPVLSPIESISLGRITSKYDRRIWTYRKQKLRKVCTFRSFDNILMENQRLENWGARRAALRPYFAIVKSQKPLIFKASGVFQNHFAPRFNPAFQSRWVRVCSYQAYYNYFRRFTIRLCHSPAKRSFWVVSHIILPQIRQLTVCLDSWHLECCRCLLLTNIRKEYCLCDWDIQDLAFPLMPKPAEPWRSVPS